MNKALKKIFFVLALYAFAGGIYYNFLELWMTENNMTSQTVSTVLSLCSMLTVSVLFLCSNLLKKSGIKQYISITLLIKGIILTSLFFLNNSGLNILIKFLVMCDWVIDVTIMVPMYPLISSITKDDKLFAIKGLIYDGFYYVAVILVGNLLGRKIGIITIDYNFYVIVSAVLILICSIIMINTKIELKKEKEKNIQLLQLIGKFKKDKITMLYLLFVIFASIGFYSVMGILMTILVGKLNYTPPVASNIKVFTGLIGVFLASIILKKLTLKNNYINFLIKIGGRFIFYLIAAIYPNKITMMAALLYALVLSPAYSHVTDAPYINRYDGSTQLAFVNLKEMIGYLGRAIGTAICGFSLAYSLRLNFIFATIAVIIEIAVGLTAMRLYQQEKEGN